LRDRIDDPVGIDTASRTDLVDDRIAVNNPLCEERGVCDLLLQPENSNVDVGEPRANKGFLDRVDLVIGEGHLIELRWINRKEAAGDLMRDST